MNGDGSGYKVLHDFVEASANPQGVVEGSDGLLYGATYYGGTNGVGNVFKLNKDGTGYRALHQFQSSGGDGRIPCALALGRDGVLYGATHYGGSSNLGTVFKINRDGSGHSILRSFGSDTTDGQNPAASLIHASDGALYGTTSSGGSSNYGTVFKLNTDGSGYVVLKHFNGSDGHWPCGGLVFSNATLYGTTSGGGDSGGGTVFKIGTDGSGFTLLSSFSFSSSAGCDPIAGPVLSDNTLYGTTSDGANIGGSVFRVNTDGSGFTVLKSLPASSGGVGIDGVWPVSPLVVAGTTLYGPAEWGGELRQRNAVPAQHRRHGLYRPETFPRRG